MVYTDFKYKLNFSFSQNASLFGSAEMLFIRPEIPRSEHVYCIHSIYIPIIYGLLNRFSFP